MALDALIKGAEAWSLLSNGQKADILRACLLLLKKHHQAAAENAVSKKGSYESGAGEDLCVASVTACLLWPCCVPVYGSHLSRVM